MVPRLYCQEAPIITHRHCDPCILCTALRWSVGSGYTVRHYLLIILTSSDMQKVTPDIPAIKLSPSPTHHPPALIIQFIHNPSYPRLVAGGAGVWCGVTGAAAQSEAIKCHWCRPIKFHSIFPRRSDNCRHILIRAITWSRAAACGSLALSVGWLRWNSYLLFGDWLPDILIKPWPHFTQRNE